MTHVKMNYKKQIDLIANLSGADAANLARHRNPILREHVAPILAGMAARHANGEFNRAKDEQDCDAIMFYSDAGEIRKAARG